MSPPRRRAPRVGLPPGTAALLRRALEEDRWTRDVTTRAILPHRLPGRAQVIAQGSGVLSGLEAARALAVIAGLRSASSLSDGAAVRSGTVVLELSGDLRRILAVERTMLNFLMHLSGVATMTAAVGEKARRARPGFRIRATRKTLPGLRDLEKAAVVHGGGESHRRDLSDAVLIKSTHLALVPLEEAVRRA
ncbi:MAG: carboxylating.nicotinate-nucleotide diphosphorylase, partial [Thermoplasmata archaeon]